MAKAGDVVGGDEDVQLVTVTLADGRDGQGVLTLVDRMERDIEHDTLPKVFLLYFVTISNLCGTVFFAPLRTMNQQSLQTSESFVLCIVYVLSVG